MTIRVLVPSGVLGLGFDTEALTRGISLKPDIICIDGGSTDSGPHYLGTGTSKYARSATRSEWRTLMQARETAGVPLVIGSCGTCGTDSTVDWMLDITLEIAAELAINPKIALLYSSQPSRRIIEALAADRIQPLQPAPAINAETLERCTNIVALAGAEQINAALATGADIILAGRTTDTAIIAALPLARGVQPGIAWHGAKIAECGALCSTNPTSGVIVVDFKTDEFVVTPMARGARCTPHSVSAHMLYENADPFLLHEPGGSLDVSNAQYESVNDSVRVTGSLWNTAERYTVKLEGAKCAGYQTTIMALLRDQRYVDNAELWAEKLKTFLVDEIRQRMYLSPEDYDLEFRLIGKQAVLGVHETRQSAPVEIGVLGMITAPTADTAEEIGKLINPFVLHYPLTEHEELPTFAFPYSPAQSDRGALYEFVLNHTMALADPMDGFRLVLHDSNGSTNNEQPPSTSIGQNSAW